MKKWKIAGLVVCAMMIATLYPAAAEPDSLDSTENVRDNDYHLVIKPVYWYTFSISYTYWGFVDEYGYCYIGPITVYEYTGWFIGWALDP